MDHPDALPPQTKFELHLHATYFNSGWFNVPGVQDRFVGGYVEQIDIFFGRADSPIIGSMNRRAKLNSTSGVMGDTLPKDWFQSNSSAWANINSGLRTSNEIHLETMA